MSIGGTTFGLRVALEQFRRDFAEAKRLAQQQSAEIQAILDEQRAALAAPRIAAIQPAADARRLAQEATGAQQAVARAASESARVIARDYSAAMARAQEAAERLNAAFRGPTTQNAVGQQIAAIGQALTQLKAGQGERAVEGLTGAIRRLKDESANLGERIARETERGGAQLASGLSARQRALDDAVQSLQQARREARGEPAGGATVAGEADATAAIAAQRRALAELRRESGRPIVVAIEVAGLASARAQLVELRELASAPIVIPARVAATRAEEVAVEGAAVERVAPQIVPPQAIQVRLDEATVANLRATLEELRAQAARPIGIGLNAYPDEAALARARALIEREGGKPVQVAVSANTAEAQAALAALREQAAAPLALQVEVRGLAQAREQLAALRGQAAGPIVVEAHTTIPTIPAPPPAPAVPVVAPTPVAPAATEGFAVESAAAEALTENLAALAAAKRAVAEAQVALAVAAGGAGEALRAEAVAALDAGEGLARATLVARSLAEAQAALVVTAGGAAEALRAQAVAALDAGEAQARAALVARAPVPSAVLGRAEIPPAQPVAATLGDTGQVERGVADLERRAASSPIRIPIELTGLERARAQLEDLRLEAARRPLAQPIVPPPPIQRAEQVVERRVEQAPIPPIPPAVAPVEIAGLEAARAELAALSRRPPIRIPVELVGVEEARARLESLRAEAVRPVAAPAAQPIEQLVRQRVEPPAIAPIAPTPQITGDVERDVRRAAAADLAAQGALQAAQGQTARATDAATGAIARQGEVLARAAIGPRQYQSALQSLSSGLAALLRASGQETFNRIISPAGRLIPPEQDALVRARRLAQQAGEALSSDRPVQALAGVRGALAELAPELERLRAEGARIQEGVFNPLIYNDTQEALRALTQQLTAVDTAYRQLGQTEQRVTAQLTGVAQPTPQERAAARAEADRVRSEQRIGQQAQRDARALAAQEARDGRERVGEQRRLAQQAAQEARALAQQQALDERERLVERRRLIQQAQQDARQLAREPAITRREVSADLAAESARARQVAAAAPPLPPLRLPDGGADLDRFADATRKAEAAIGGLRTATGTFRDELPALRGALTQAEAALAALRRGAGAEALPPIADAERQVQAVIQRLDAQRATVQAQRLRMPSDPREAEQLIQRERQLKAEYDGTVRLLGQLSAAHRGVEADLRAAGRATQQQTGFANALSQAWRGVTGSARAAGLQGRTLTEVSGAGQAVRGGTGLVQALGIPGVESGPALAAAAAVAAVGVALAATAAEGLKFNSALQQTTIVWETLLDSSTKGQQAVRDIFAFAQATPYNFEQVNQATRTLEVFGGSALNTRENLTRIGDAAAGVQQPIQQVAFWVARMHESLEGGQPIGREILALQRMGLVSGETARRIQGLQAAGASSDEIFAALLQSFDKFTGLMDRQSHTVQGAAQRIGDSFSILAAAATKPEFAILNAALNQIADALGGPDLIPRVEALGKALVVTAQAFATLVSFGGIPIGIAIRGRIDEALAGPPQQVRRQAEPAEDIDARLRAQQAAQEAGTRELRATLPTFDKSDVDAYKAAVDEVRRSFTALGGGTLTDQLARRFDEAEPVIARIVDDIRTYGAVRDETMARGQAVLGGEYDAVVRLATGYEALARAQGRLAGAQATKTGLQSVLDQTRRDAETERNPRGPTAPPVVEPSPQRGLIPGTTPEQPTVVVGGVKEAQDEFDRLQERADNTRKANQATLDGMRRGLQDLTDEARKNADGWDAYIRDLQVGLEGLQATAQRHQREWQDTIQGLQDGLDKLQAQADANRQHFADMLTPLQDELKRLQNAASEHAGAFQAIEGGTLDLFLQEHREIDDVTRAIIARWDAEISGARRAKEAADERVQALTAEEDRVRLDFDRRIAREREAGREASARALERRRDLQLTGLRNRGQVTRDEAAVAGDDLTRASRGLTRAQQEQATADTVAQTGVQQQIDAIQKRATEQEKADQAAIKGQQGRIKEAQAAAQAQARQDQDAVEGQQAIIKEAQRRKAVDQDNFQARERQAQDDINNTQRTQNAQEAKDQQAIDDQQRVVKARKDYWDQEEAGQQAQIDIADRLVADAKAQVDAAKEYIDATGTINKLLDDRLARELAILNVLRQQLGLPPLTSQQVNAGATGVAGGATAAGAAANAQAGQQQAQPPPQQAPQLQPGVAYPKDALPQGASIPAGYHIECDNRYCYVIRDGQFLPKVPEDTPPPPPPPQDAAPPPRDRPGGPSRIAFPERAIAATTAPPDIRGATEQYPAFAPTLPPRPVEVPIAAIAPVRVPVESPAPVHVDTRAPAPVIVTALPPAPVQVEARAPLPVEVVGLAPPPVQVEATPPDIVDVRARAPELVPIPIIPPEPVHVGAVAPPPVELVALPPRPVEIPIRPPDPIVARAVAPDPIRVEAIAPAPVKVVALPPDPISVSLAGIAPPRPPAALDAPAVDLPGLDARALHRPALGLGGGQIVVGGVNITIGKLAEVAYVRDEADMERWGEVVADNVEERIAARDLASWRETTRGGIVSGSLRS